MKYVPLLLLLLPAVAMADQVPITVRFTPPTKNADDSPLTDLAGFHVLTGLSSRNYTHSERIDDPTATEHSYTADLPLVAGQENTIYLAMTAFDDDGNESAESNEVTKVVDDLDPKTPIVIDFDITGTITISQ